MKADPKTVLDIVDLQTRFSTTTFLQLDFLEEFGISSIKIEVLYIQDIPTTLEQTRDKVLWPQKSTELALVLGIEVSISVNRSPNSLRYDEKYNSPLQQTYSEINSIWHGGNGLRNQSNVIVTC